MLASLTQLALLLDETALETLLFWLSGGFADRPLALLWVGVSALVIALAGCALLGPSIDALRLDDQSAAGIGVDVARTRITALSLAAEEGHVNIMKAILDCDVPAERLLTPDHLGAGPLMRASENGHVDAEPLGCLSRSAEFIRWVKRVARQSMHRRIDGEDHLTAPLQKW